MGEARGRIPVADNRDLGSVTIGVAGLARTPHAESHRLRIFGFAGWSGSGKTTLIERVIPRLTGRGLRVSLIKHAHHQFDVDQPGKDSCRHREAGCTEVLITSGTRWALMHELRGQPELSLEDALSRLSPCDLALVEGYKAFPIPKIEIWRPDIGKPLLHPADPQILAIATDRTEQLPPASNALVRLGLDDFDAIAAFVVGHAILWPPGH